MKIRSFLVPVTALAVLGGVSVAQAERYSYHPRFVAGVSQLERATENFHADYARFFRSLGRRPASCPYRQLLEEARETAERSARIAEQVRRGVTPCQIEANAERLEANFRTVDALVKRNRVSSRLWSQWSQTHGLYTAVHRGFERALFAHNQSLKSPRRGGYAHADGRADWPSYGRISQPHPPRAEAASTDDLLRFFYSRFFNR